jgi:hypothetical protein
VEAVFDVAMEEVGSEEAASLLRRLAFAVGVVEVPEGADGTVVDPSEHIGDCSPGGESVVSLQHKRDIMVGGEGREMV